MESPGLMIQWRVQNGTVHKYIVLEALGTGLLRAGGSVCGNPSAPMPPFSALGL